jgi:hypothetical protein
VTHSRQKRLGCSELPPRSATGVTGPRKNGIWACWPRWYLAIWSISVKLRNDLDTDVVLSQMSFLLPRKLAWMTLGRVLGKPSTNRKVSTGLKATQLSKAFCRGPVA